MFGDLTPIARDYLPADTAPTRRATISSNQSMSRRCRRSGGGDAVAASRRPIVRLLKPSSPAPSSSAGCREDHCWHMQFANVRGIRHIVNWHPNRISFVDHDLLTDGAWLAGLSAAQIRPYLRSPALSRADGRRRRCTANAETLIILNHTGMPSSATRMASSVAGRYARLAPRRMPSSRFPDSAWSTGVGAWDIRPFVFGASSVSVWTVRCSVAISRWTDFTLVQHALRRVRIDRRRLLGDERDAVPR